MNTEDIIYDLEAPENSGLSGSADDSENSENSESPEIFRNQESNSGSPDISESNSESCGMQEKSPAQAEIEQMIEEVGAETLLDIIKDNRNAAIRQILNEVEASRPPLQSGTSAARGCSSIFDLAALA